jgi:hypothetical protein
MAASGQPMARTAMFRCPSEASRPAVNSRESPGRKKPARIPDSAKTMARMPTVPKASMRWRGSIRGTLAVPSHR